MTLTAVAPSFAEVRVEHVGADSPASDAGVRAGDDLIALDGKPVTGASLDLAYAALRDVGAERVLDLTRAGQKRQVRIRLRELVR